MHYKLYNFGPPPLYIRTEISESRMKGRYMIGRLQPITATLVNVSPWKGSSVPYDSNSG